MSKKAIAILVVLVMALSTALVGCGSDTPTKTASNEKVTIHFMDIMPGPEREQVYQDMISKFEAKNPNIHVELETVPWDQAHNKLVTLGTSKSMPDVVQIYPQWLSEFTAAKWLADLDPYYKNYEYKDSFIPFVQKISMQHDQRDLYKGLYAIPDALMVGGLFYRTDWFKQANIQPPTTWDEFFADAQKLTDKSQNHYGLAYRGARAGFDQILNYILSVTNGQLYDKDGNSLLITPEAINAFTRYTDIYKKGYTPKDSINWGYAEMVQGFTSGLTGMLNQTTEVVTACSKNMKDGTWAVASWPKGTDGNIYGSASYSTGYGIPTNSTHKDEAWKFIAFISSPEMNMEYSKGNTLVPIVKEAQSDPSFAQGPMKGFVDMLAGTNYAVAPVMGYFPELGQFRENFMDSEVQKYLLGQQNAEDTMKHLGDTLTKYQKNYMKGHPDVPIPAPLFIKDIK